MKARVPLFCLNMEIVYTNTITHIDTCAADRVYNSPRWRQDPVQVLAGGTPAVEEIRKFTMMAAFTAIMFMMMMKNHDDDTIDNTPHLLVRTI